MGNKEINKVLAKIRVVRDITPEVFASVLIEESKEKFYSCLKRCFYIWHRSQLGGVKKQENNYDFDWLIEVCKGYLKDPYISYYLAYLKFSNIFFDQSLTLNSRIEKVNDEALEDWKKNLDLDVVESVRACVLGSLLSSFDRDRARELYAYAIKNSAELISFYSVDAGVFTYYSSLDINRKNSNISDFLDKELCLYSTITKKEICLIASLDERFLRIYAPNIITHLIGLEHYNFHFTICGNEKSKEYVDEFMKLISEYEKFARVSIKDRISFSYFEVPDWVKEKKTLYACARFFTAKRILSEKLFESVYIMDIDLTVTEDISSFMKKQMGYMMSFSFSRNNAALYPWRRFLAGNVFIGNKALHYLSLLCDYILFGLKEKNSWMLDQNALDYIYYLQDDKSYILNNAQEKKPFSQFQFRQILEKNIR